MIQRHRHQPQAELRDSAVPAINRKLTVASALIYTLAFNLIFFIQELFLVIPKAFTAGLRPTLFHNNHQWEGDNPVGQLLQGTGALATFITAAVCALLLFRGWGRTSTRRLFLIWLAYNGFFQSLPQVIIGAFIPANDVGMATDYLGLTAAAKITAAVAAACAIPFIAVCLTRYLLSLAEDSEPAAEAPAQAAAATAATEASAQAAAATAAAEAPAPADSLAPANARPGSNGF